eukprot:3938989-Rhodomonas_salina.1
MLPQGNLLHAPRRQDAPENVLQRGVVTFDDEHLHQGVDALAVDGANALPKPLLMVPFQLCGSDAQCSGIVPVLRKPGEHKLALPLHPFLQVPQVRLHQC